MVLVILLLIFTHESCIGLPVLEVSIDSFLQLTFESFFFFLATNASGVNSETFVDTLPLVMVHLLPQSDAVILISKCSSLRMTDDELVDLWLQHW